MALISVSSHSICCICSEYLNMGRVRTCGPDKTSKNDRKSQINIEIRNCFSIPKRVCVCGGWGWVIRYSVPLTAKSVGGGSCPTPSPPPNDAHAVVMVLFIITNHTTLFRAFST